MWGRASSASRNPARLAERRKKRRQRALIALLILSLIALGALIWGLWQAPVRIARVTVVGADQSLAALATSALEGSYLGIIPHDSTFFYPAGKIHASIKAAHPEIAALSISHDGLEGLSIKPDYRVPIARWCGLAPSEGVEEYCYLFDANGFVFAAADTSSSTPINNFKLYALLEGDGLEPLRGEIAHASILPSTFDFARSLTPLGSPVTAIVVRGDEVDDHLASGTRITYVLGKEQDAFTALTSAKASINLASGAVDYVDLRFPGKVYVKKVKE